MILADYTFGQGLLTVLEIFLFAAWLMVLFHDLRRPVPRPWDVRMG